MTNTALFFSLFTKINETIHTFTNNTPLIFWFDGGPGCSSQYDFWESIGALKYDPIQDKIMEREITWNRNSMIVYVDQPVGTGFSYSNSDKLKVSNTVESGLMFLEFLETFYNWFPNMTSLKTSFFGESYAGHYVPYYAEIFIKNNKWNVPFYGIGVGNGWFDPKIQLQSYGQQYFSIGVVSQSQYLQVLGQQNLALNYYQQKNYSGASYMADNITNLTSKSSGGYLEEYGGISIYNFQDYKKNSDFQYEDYNKLLRKSSFRIGYGIPKYVPQYQDCNNTVSKDYVIDNSISYKFSLEFILKEQVNVFLFNGQLDIVCNNAGVQQVINQLEWQNLTLWQNKPKQIWQINNQTVGTIKSYNNLCFTAVYKAGHITTIEQPGPSYDMFLKYLNWQW